MWADRLSFYFNLSNISNKISGTKHPHESNGLKFTLIKQLFNNNEHLNDAKKRQYSSVGELVFVYIWL